MKFNLLLILFLNLLNINFLFSNNSNWKENLTFFPFIAYTPETSVLIGAGTTYSFKLSSNVKEKPSYTNLLFIFSFDKQNMFINTSELVLPKNYFLKYKLGYFYFPSKFYGVGNNTSQDDEENFTLNEFIAGLGFYKTIYQYFSFGLSFEFVDTNILDTVSEGLIKSNIFLGKDGGILFGIGPSLIWDKRDHVFYPKRGEYFQADILWYLDSLSSDYDFLEFTLDLRKYFNVYSDDVLAIQIFNQILDGDIPFYKLAKLGDRNTLRGVYIGKYRDTNLISFQLEYRKMFTSRFGAVLFTGAGKVAENANNLFSSGFKTVIGTGSRIALNKKNKINLRTDIAYGDNELSFYISYMEAF